MADTRLWITRKLLLSLFNTTIYSIHLSMLNLYKLRGFIHHYGVLITIEQYARGKLGSSITHTH